MRAILFGLLLLCGCRGEAASPSTEPPRSVCQQQSFDGSRFTVCDNEGGKLLLFANFPDERPLRSFAVIAAHVEPDFVAFAMNAGMFDEAGRPIGLTGPTHGRGRPVNLRDGPGNFHMKPNGVFMVTCGGGRAIFRADAIPEFRCAPELMTQSGPMLVIDGKLHPRFEPDGESRHIRNGVGVTADQRALFVISEDPVSLGKFARFFRDRLKTPNALYFDGSVSSLWDPANGRRDAHSPLGPILVALKPAESAPGREGRARP